jgi:hypothetical protein
MYRVSRAAIAGAVASALCGSAAVAAEPSEKDACIQAAESGQELRDDQKFAQARESFSRCVRETCPAIIRQDCSGWLAQIDDKVPTIVLAAEDPAGRDLLDVDVSVDGQPLSSRLDGKPVRLDPGSHTLHFEASGFLPADQTIVASLGEKNRPVLARLAEKPHDAPATQPRAAAAPMHPPSPARGPVPAATWVFGAVAAAAFASEAYFGITAMNDLNRDLAVGGCAPHCGQGEQSAIRTKSAIADVSLGVGLVASAAAAYFFFFHRAPAHLVGSLDVTPTPGGAVATVGGRFR